MDPFIRALWAIAAVLVAAIVAWVGTERWSQHEIAAARRTLDARTAELVQRALVPGSPLACLDAVASAAVEAACEKALFASPETVAAAITYVDAKLNLLADGVALAERNPAYAAELERLRRGLEADRFGIVAQALVSRGCSADGCAALKLFRDPQRVAANLNERTFEANVVLHASAWPAGAVVAAAPQAAPAAPTLAGVATVAAVPSKYEFPSAASIPPVSIMNAEPPLSKAQEAAIAPPAPPPAARPQQPARRQASPPRDTPAAAQPPTSIVPLPQPAPIAPGASLR